MEINEKQIQRIINKQRSFFNTKKTYDLSFRIENLNKLKQLLIDNQNLISEALKKDLNRSEYEAYLCDIGPIISEINETIKGVKKWAKPETHFSGLLCFPSIFTKVYKNPYGVTLIISPFNFPFLLSFGVLAASIAAGNTAIIKTSSKSTNSTIVMKKLVKEYFNDEYITVIDGGHEVADLLLKSKVDKIFYTGSPNVAKHVLELASQNLTPVSLELGGETGNYAIVCKDANIKDAAHKIAFFKILNSGQICIDINQVAVDESIADKFIKELINEFKKQSANILESDEYPKMINEKAFDKTINELNKYKKKICYGGKYSRDNLRIEPTIIYPVSLNDDIVNHELFSPLLPVVKFNDINKLIKTIEDREHPLALYLFTNDINWGKETLSKMQFGGGCINEVCNHLMVKGVPFNGTGHSGMGAYHGKWGFDEFSHPSTVLIGNNKLDLPLRYHPYSDIKLKLLKIFEK